MLLGMQYYFGEPVQLWSEGDEVYLVRTDGSREKLIAIPQAAAMCCYLDGDGSIYCWERYAPWIQCHNIPPYCYFPSYHILQEKSDL